MSSQQPSHLVPFAESTAASAVKSACGEIGVPSPRDLELLRIGENALFADPSQKLVYRVARSDTLTAKVAKELATARWLVRQGFPAIPPRDDLTQPVAVEGRLVTFWEYVPPGPTPHQNCPTWPSSCEPCTRFRSRTSSSRRSTPSR